MLWATAQSGSNPVPGLNFTTLGPGETIALLDGTETVATGSFSVAVAIGYDPNGSTTKTFITNGCGAGSVIDIQASNGVIGTPTLAGMNSSFANVGGTMNSNGPQYTDIGASEFYRVTVTSFVSGDKPVVLVRLS